MREQWKGNRHLYPLMLVVLTTAVGTFLQNDICRYELPAWVMLVQAAAAAAVYLGCAVWKLRFLLGLGLAVAAGAVITAAGGKAGVLWDAAVQYGSWYFAGRGEPLAAYYPVALAVSSLLLTALASAAVAYGWLQRILAAVVLVLLAGSFLADRPFTAPTAVCGFLYLFVTALDICQKRLERQEKERRQRILLTLLPVIALTGLLLMLAPKPQEAYDWKFVKDLIQFVSDSIEETVNRIHFFASRESDVYSLRFTGYSESAELGDGLLPEDGTALSVTFRVRPYTNLYLVGSVWDTFEDGGWSVRAQAAPEEPDYLTERVAQYEEGSLQSSLYSLVGITITYENIYTQTLFWPEDMTHLAIPKTQWVREENRLRLKQPQGNGYSYQATWRQLNLGSEVWDAFLRQQLAWPAAEDEYTAYVYETYLQDPELSGQVQAYIDAATAGAESDYDRLLAVEALLRQYAYTLRPQPITEKSAFLDTFLLNTQEGYCTYFATAFTLISRYLGFPARYVQGYCVPAQGIGSGRTVEVSSEYAHAWTEVWIDGVGWIPFEPTPSYGSMRYVPWTVEKKTVQPQVPELPEESDTQPQMQPQAEETEEMEGAMAFLKAAGAVCLLLAAAAAAGILILEGLRRKWERTSAPAALFARDIRQCERILRELGAERKEWETFSAYRRRLRQPEELAALLARIPFAEYEALCYGGIVPAAETIAAAKAAKGQVYEYYRSHSGKLRGWFLFWKLRYTAE